MKGNWVWLYADRTKKTNKSCSVATRPYSQAADKLKSTCQRGKIERTKARRLDGWRPTKRKDIGGVGGRWRRLPVAVSRVGGGGTSGALTAAEAAAEAVVVESSEKVNHTNHTTVDDPRNRGRGAMEGWE